MAIDIQKKLKKERKRSYLAKDTNSFRADLLRYAQAYFPDKIKDFSEASLGGLFIDMAAVVGDTMAFYLDHQFNEVNHDTAIEVSNIRRHIENAGVKITGAAPSSLDVRFYIEVDAELSGEQYTPKASSLPVILAGTTLSSQEGIQFSLTQDLNFSEKDIDDNLIAEVEVSETVSSRPSKYIMYLDGLCVSGVETAQSISISDVHVPFRKIVLEDENITTLVSVKDSDNNTYYEVDSLTQDTVFKSINNLDIDNNFVKKNIEIVPAPYRYVKKFDPRTKLTTMQFGAGAADSLDDDIIPDPSELSLPLYGKNTFARFSIDPNALLKSHTLGISPLNTTLSVVYRHGGGLNHNVAAESVRVVDTLNIRFLSTAVKGDSDQVRASVDVVNLDRARGGADALTLDEFRSQIPSARQAQSRIVTRQDLYARIYTMPSEFGRVYRVGMRQSPINQLAAQLYIASKDSDGKLDTSPDSLKKNLRTYLNEYRLVSDAIDILDAQILNYIVRFDVATYPHANKVLVVQNIISNLTRLLDTANFQIDQPILMSDIINVVLNTSDVISINTLTVESASGTIDDRKYGNSSINIAAATKKGIIVAPAGSIFELKYPRFDIIGSAS
jgi:hypothetical protein